jgi:hypothetical protein
MFSFWICVGVIWYVWYVWSVWVRGGFVLWTVPNCTMPIPCQVSAHRRQAQRLHIASNYSKTGAANKVRGCLCDVAEKPIKARECGDLERNWKRNCAEELCSRM